MGRTTAMLGDGVGALRSVGAMDVDRIGPVRESEVSVLAVVAA